MLLLVIFSVLFVVVSAVLAVFVYRRWRKKGQRSRNPNRDEEVLMNPVTREPVSLSLELGRRLDDY